MDKRNPSESRILVTETGSEILDNLKSRGDALANLSAVLQTTWCIAQYVERWAAHHPKTLLEVVTLACVVLAQHPDLLFVVRQTLQLPKVD